MHSSQHLQASVPPDERHLVPYLSDRLLSHLNGLGSGALRPFLGRRLHIFQKAGHPLGSHCSRNSGVRSATVRLTIFARWQSCQRMLASLHHTGRMKGGQILQVQGSGLRVPRSMLPWVHVLRRP